MSGMYNRFVDGRTGGWTDAHTEAGGVPSRMYAAQHAARNTRTYPATVLLPSPRGVSRSPSRFSECRSVEVGRRASGSGRATHVRYMMRMGGGGGSRSGGGHARYVGTTEGGLGCRGTQHGGRSTRIDDTPSYCAVGAIAVQHALSSLGRHWQHGRHAQAHMFGCQHRSIQQAF